jgi:hypothetical protein
VFDCHVHFTGRIIRVENIFKYHRIFQNQKSTTSASAALANANETEASTATAYPSVPDPGHPTVLAEAAILS